VSGEVVERSHAQSRAQVCVGCPFNQDGSLFEDLTGVAAMAMKTLLEIKSKRLLRVENEHLLKVCEKCGCETSVLVHAPMKVILKEMTKEQMEEHPSFCWKKKEAQDV
jgi:hypothetical protein